MKKIYLIDANNLIYRMFFALPEFNSPAGDPVNAIFGVAKWIVNSLATQKPDYVFFIKDAKGKNFRHDLYEDYKATRDRMPDDLRSQIDLMESMIEKMGIEIISPAGYEADDLIGTLATHFGKDKTLQTYILSSDKDLHSLVQDNVFVYDMMKRTIFSPDKTTEKFGVTPDYIIDYLAIMGDKSDNIPGIDGFGPKKAVDLINNIGALEKIYDMADRVVSGDQEVGELEKAIQSCFKGKTFEKLIASRENAFLSKKLATIDLQVPFEFTLEDYSYDSSKIVNDDVKTLFSGLGFHSLYEEEKQLKTWKDTGLKVQIIGDNTGLSDLEKKLEQYSDIVLDTETTSLDIMKADLVGVSVYLDDDNIYYINRLHRGSQIDNLQLQKFLQNILDSDKTVIGHNIKYDLQIITLFLENGSKKSSIQAGEQIGLGI
ncbi:hypothetical protein OAN96_01190 [Candidatus Gracilibacteria bacterium]|nr:hypothetical protein [Candidatus Gracilibacteria bacterium]